MSGPRPVPEPMLRPAGPADEAAVFNLLMQTYRATWEPHLSPAAAARFASGSETREYVRAHLAEVIVAEYESRVVGMVHAKGNFIDALHVLPDMQRAGIGGRLLAHAEERMRRAGHTQSRLETDTFNERSRAFYARHGYTEIDTYPDEEWDSGFTTILMTHSL